MGMCFGYTGVIMKLIKFHSNGNKAAKIDVFKLKFLGFWKNMKFSFCTNQRNYIQFLFRSAKCVNWDNLLNVEKCDKNTAFVNPYVEQLLSDFQVDR